MKTSVEKVSDIVTKLTVTVPAKEIDPKVVSKTKQTANQIKLDGFRPGKAPLKVVERRFGESIRQDVIGEVIQQQLYQAFAQEKINPAGMPKVDITTNKTGSDLVFTVEVEVYPEVKVKGLDKIKIEKATSEVTDADLDKMLETLQKQYTDWKEVKRACKNDDKVYIDFEGTMDGKVFEGGSANETPLVLGSKSMIDGFESGIVGMKPGDERDIKLKFPKEYQAKDLAGKDVNFKITLHKIEEPKLPELDAKFAKKLEVKNIEELKKEVRGNMERELEFSLKRELKDKVMDGVLKENKITLPEGAVSEEIKNLKEQAIAQFASYGNNNMKASSLPDDMFKERAERRVSLGLLMNGIIEANKLKPDANRVEDMIKTMSAAYQDSDKAIAEYAKNKDRLAEVEQIVLEDQVVDVILEQASVTTKKVNFFDAVKTSNAAMV